MSAVRPFVLVILDGWGCNADPYGNAIAAARTPEFDAMEGECPHTEVEASGEAVGLPPGQQGNSEVGHLTIGAGRLILQPLSRISRAIEDGSFYENAALRAVVDRARDRGAALHCLGLDLAGWGAQPPGSRGCCRRARATSGAGRSLVSRVSRRPR